MIMTPMDDEFFQHAFDPYVAGRCLLVVSVLSFNADDFEAALRSRAIHHLPRLFQGESFESYCLNSTCEWGSPSSRCFRCRSFISRLRSKLYQERTWSPSRPES